MFINTSHNARSGQAFVMVHRNGVELHVYGTGKNRHVVEMRRHSDPVDTSTKPSTGTTTSTGATTTAGTVTTDASSIT